MKIDAWITENSKSPLQPADAKPFELAPPTNNYPTIEVDREQTYQPLEGFGFALTGGSVSLIAAMAPGARAELLRELFGDGEGSIGLSCLRLSIGASDLGPRSFTYCDLPEGETDPALARFDLGAGDPELVPLLKQILAINPDLKIVAAPWSAPGWMKNNDNLVAGSLKPEFYDAYARYFVKYIEAMRGHGIRISMVTPQNEPLNAKNDPSLVMSAAEQADFIREHLGPALQKFAPDTELFCWDHNCDKPEYPLAVLGDAGARAFISGVAWHLYAGTADVMSDVHAKYPEQKTYFTEQWVFSGDDFDGALRWHMKYVAIGTIRNWSRVVLEWNLASDAECQIHTPGGAVGSLGGITIGETVSRNAGYYLMAHTARFIRPGSVRIQSNEVGPLANFACVTPDDMVVMVMVNDSAATTRFNVRYQDRYATLALEAGCVATFRWPAGRAVA